MRAWHSAHLPWARTKSAVGCCVSALGRALLIRNAASISANETVTAIKTERKPIASWPSGSRASTLSCAQSVARATNVAKVGSKARVARQVKLSAHPYASKLSIAKEWCFCWKYAGFQVAIGDDECAGNLALVRLLWSKRRLTSQNASIATSAAISIHANQSPHF